MTHLNTCICIYFRFSIITFIYFTGSPLQNAQIKNTTDATTTEMTSSLSARLKGIRTIFFGRIINNFSLETKIV